MLQRQSPLNPVLGSIPPGVLHRGSWRKNMSDFDADFQDVTEDWGESEAEIGFETGLDFSAAHHEDDDGEIYVF